MENGHIISTKNASHYKWGQHNDGWYLLNDALLAVIEESMGPGSSERLHFHTKAQQLFYILSGEADFELGAENFRLCPGESIHVPPGIHHKISNNNDAALRFLVVSSPPSQGDRIDINFVS